MAHLYINLETWSDSSISKVVFASKRKAIANAKRWTGHITGWQTDIVLKRVTTWEMHDDCELGTYLTEIENLANNAKIINIEIAE